jgi:hypothetical protein
MKSAHAPPARPFGWIEQHTRDCRKNLKGEVCVETWKVAKYPKSFGRSLRREKSVSHLHLSIH